MPVDLRSPEITHVHWTCGKVLKALQMAGLAPEAPDGDPDFPPHWDEGLHGEGWYTGIRLGKVWVAPSDNKHDRTWFRTVEEADAWVLACWRMK